MIFVSGRFATVSRNAQVAFVSGNTAYFDTFPLYVGVAAVQGDPGFGTVSHGLGVALGRGMTHMDSVGFREVATPFLPENETT